MEFVYHRVPFPIFRMVVEYMGVIPPLSANTTRSLSQHFQEKYCCRCGDYICARKYVSKRPYHISCRQRYYTPDHQNTRYFHFQRVSIFPLLFGFEPHWRNDIQRCPIVLYSKQPLNYYSMDICNDTQDLSKRGGAVVHYRYQSNEKILNVHHNPCFTVIPEVFSKDLQSRYSRTVMISLLDIMSSITKLDIMKKFKVHSAEHIIQWLLKLCPTVLECIQPFQFYGMRRLLERVPTSLQYQAVLSLGPERLAQKDSRWFQKILLDFPQILNILEEKTIQRIFQKNKQWFLQYLKLQPKALEYVSIVNYRRRYY